MGTFPRALLAALALGATAGEDPPLDAVLAAGAAADITTDDRAAVLRQLLATIRVQRTLAPDAPTAAAAAPTFGCPAPGAGVGNWTTELEKHHYLRHSTWAKTEKHCENALGLWTQGCGVMCPLRTAIIGLATGLRPGDLVVDVGSACGHAARWYHQWFGARTFGVDFVGDAASFAQARVASEVPAQFCWYDLASHASWLPSGVANLATAVSVLHYLRTDRDRFEAGEQPSYSGAPRARRTPCLALRGVKGTQCGVAREMFRTLRVGGRVWISHNGSYRGKWDPRRVWGEDYWRCCFAPEVEGGRAELREVDELDLFLHSRTWDPTYSVIVRRLA